MAMFTREQLYSDNGQARTKSLFVDFGGDPANILTLGTNNKAYPSLRRLYVNLCVGDPSEFLFAETIFGEWAYWEKLSKSGFMQEHLESWRHEAAVQRKSMAFKHIIEEVKSNGRNGYHAAKYLVEEPWTGTTKAARASSKKSSAEAAESTEIVRIEDFLKSRSK